MNTCSELALVDLQVDVPEARHLVVADLVTPGHLLEPDHGRHAGTVPRVWLVLHVDAHSVRSSPVPSCRPRAQRSPIWTTSA